MINDYEYSSLGNFYLHVRMVDDIKSFKMLLGKILKGPKPN